MGIGYHTRKKIADNIFCLPENKNLKQMPAVKIPYDQLSSEALQGVIEEFVTLDGTDYGEIEVSLETKISQVLGQLKSGN